MAVASSAWKLSQSQARVAYARCLKISVGQPSHHRVASIATVKGELYNNQGKLAATLLHTADIMKSDFKENIN